MTARWRGYYTQLPGDRWSDETVAQAATSAVGARLAHHLRFCEAERDKAAVTAQQAEERIARPDARRSEALDHNEASAAMSLELEAFALAARARVVAQREAMTVGWPPMRSGSSTPPGTPRSSTPEPWRQQVRQVRQARQARQPRQGWDRGLNRDGPGLGL